MGEPETVQPPKNKPKPCCGEREQDYPLTYEQDRKCTDILCLLLFIAFWIAWIAVASIGFANGDPDRILYGTDYLGYVCGKNDGPTGFKVQSTPWQSSSWAKNNRLWIPIQQNDTDSSLSEMISRAVCVEICPELDNETKTAIQNVAYQYELLSVDLQEKLKVFTYGYDSRTGAFTYAQDYYWISYSSKDFYRRCLPNGLQPENLNATLSGLPGATSTTNFFYRGFIEIIDSWRIILIVSILAVYMCFIYVYLMRFIVKPLTYLSLLLVLVAIVVCAVLMLDRANALEAELENQNPKDEDTEDYEKAWRYSAYATFGLAAIYLLVVAWNWKRIKEACAMVQVSGRVIKSSPTMLLIPPIITIGIICAALWAIYVGVYLYTADNYEKGREELIPFTGNSSGLPTWTNSANETFVNSTNGILDSDDAKRNLLFFDLFGFLWTMGFINSIGFMLIAFCGVFWYYSDMVSDNKHIPTGSICKATMWCFVYHLGTLAFGSLLVAIVQFLRFLLRYIAEQCEIIQNSKTLKCIICLAECCLACFERVIKIISKNAYIICCITSESFFFAARDAFNIIVDNAVTVAILTFIVEFVMFLGKVLIIIACLCIAYAMMDDPDLAPDVETRIMPLILIAFIVYFICVVFFNVYSTIVDTMFICFHHDKIVNAAQGAYYAPEELWEQISGYDGVKAQQRVQANIEGKSQNTQPVPNQQ